MQKGAEKDQDNVQQPQAEIPSYFTKCTSKAS